VGPHTPDLARPISKLADDVKNNNYLDNISVALIGSCTNSSYEDMSRAASLAKQAQSKGIKAKIPLLVTPGSEQIRATIERDGQIDSLKSIGATVLANACGPCIGQWHRPELKKGEQNTIVTSYNRNFPGRNDGKRETMNFIASPELVIALALGGNLSFNPLDDSLTASDGKTFKLDAPERAPDVPDRGFVDAEDVYISPSSNPDAVQVLIDPNSERLQKLEPFDAWNGEDLSALHVMIKAKGKCTTDHISPAGPWLRLRGHLDKLSDNLLLGAVNAFNDQVGQAKNILSNEIESCAQIARQYKKENISWVIVGDDNYGEGSSREHAAMTPRFLGCSAVIAKSFARIHETNLKKQGILALTFGNPKDYGKIHEDDQISISQLNEIAPGKPVECNILHADKTSEKIVLNHSYNGLQIEWFKAGSAMNFLRKKQN
jgi:aconitate hydratase